MGEEVRGWRAPPPALLLGIALKIAESIGARLWGYTHHAVDMFTLRFLFTTNGCQWASSVLVGYGAYELSRRLTGRARIAVRVAAIAAVLGIVLSICDLALNAKQAWTPLLSEIDRWAWWAQAAVPPLAMCAALPRERLWVAIGAGSASALASVLPSITSDLVVALGSHDESNLYLMAREVLQAGVIAACAILVAPMRSVHDPRHAKAGLGRASNVLWVRLIAAAVLTIVMISGMNGRTQSALKMFRFSLMGVLVVNTLTMAWFAVGALRAARAELRELPRWLLVVGGGLAMFCAGVLATQIPFLYDVYYAERQYSTVLDQQVLSTFSVMLPMLSLAAMTLVGVAVWIYEARRSGDGAATQASGRVVGFCLLMLVSIAIDVRLVDEAKSEVQATLMLMASAGLAIWGQILLALVCGNAAEKLGETANLPTAKVISP